MTIRQFLNGLDTIPLDAVLNAFRSKSIEEQAIARELLVYDFKRISPPPNQNEFARALVDYYINCIPRLRSEFDLVHSRFEAAKEMQRLFEHWVSFQNEQIVSDLAYLIGEVTELYRRSGNATRNVLETGFLEHVFEIQRNRVFFQHWQSPPFQEAFDACVKWGDAHPRGAESDYGHGNGDRSSKPKASD